MPKVSVIVPVYGVEKYIERCARSLFEQTLDDIEYLFIDDCTPDKSIDVLENVLEEYPQRKSQVVIHRMEHNSGQAKVREWGFMNATGEYIIHCDSDDWIDKTLYRSMYEEAQKSNADIAICDFCHVKEDGTSTIEKGLKRADNYLKDMMYSKISWSLCNKIIKRSLFETGIMYPKQNIGEDMAMVLQASKNATKIAYVEGLYYFYYCNNTSIMNSQSKAKSVDRYNQMCSNVDIVEAAFKSGSSVPFDVVPCINAIKLYCKVLMIPALNADNIKEWNSKYNEIGCITLFNPNVRLRYKAIFILQKLHLYSIIKEIVS